MSTNYDPKDLRAQLMRHEGFVEDMYLDSLGIPTIGMGHNLRDRPVPRPLLEILADYDIAVALNDARDLCEQFGVAFSDLSGPRQMVLVDMSFNLGRVRLATFERMWRALREGDYDEASHQMLSSRWARQVGVRSDALATMMRRG